MTASPPTTPPAIAPALLLWDDLGVCEGGAEVDDVGVSVEEVDVDDEVEVGEPVDVRE